MVIFVHKSFVFPRSRQRLSAIYRSVRCDFLSCGNILLSSELLLKPLLVTLTLPMLPEGNLRLRRSIFFLFPDTKVDSANQDFLRPRTAHAPTAPLDTLPPNPPTTPICSNPTSTCLTNQKPSFKAGEFHLTTSSNPRSECGLEIRTISSTALAWRISSEVMISAL